MEIRVIRPSGFLPERLGSVLALSGIVGNLELVVGLTQREISARYRGSLLGLAWPVLQPLLLLGIYTFIFGMVFGARWSGEYGNDVAGYSVIVFAGLVTFEIFSMSVRSSPGLISRHRTFVKRVVFPLEVLPVVQVAAALVQGVAGLAVLVGFLYFSGAPIYATACWLPLVWFVLAIFSLGVCYFLSALSIFIRDFEPVVGLAITGLFFGSAIFYPIERLPETAQAIVRMMPTAAAIDLTRSLLLLGVIPPPSSYVGPFLGSVGMLVVGYIYFMKAKGKFTDAL